MDLLELITNKPGITKNELLDAYGRDIGKLRDDLYFWRELGLIKRTWNLKQRLHCYWMMNDAPPPTKRTMTSEQILALRQGFAELAERLGVEHDVAALLLANTARRKAKT